MSAPRPRYVFLGTPAFAADLLEDLVRADAGACVLAVSGPPKPKGRGLALAPSAVHARAEALGIPVWAPEIFSNEEAALRIRAADADFALAIAFGKILRPACFDAPRLGTFNLHFSLLPRWRGASPVPAALLAGDEVSGVTLQKIDEGLDTGAVAARAEVPLGDLRAPEVFAAMISVSKPLLRSFFAAWPASASSLRPQDHGAATHCGKMHKDSGRLDAEVGVARAVRMVRAYDPWPGVHLPWGDRRIVVEGFGAPGPASGDAPALVRRGKKELALVLRDGTLPVTRLKPEGKRSMDAADFLNAQPADFRIPLPLP